VTPEARGDFITELEAELLKGGVIVSEWTTFLAKDAETAYCSGAFLSAILAAQAAIETHLRFDFHNGKQVKDWSFYQLIEQSGLNADLKTALHDLRKYRNRWVHVNDPADDQDLQARPEYFEAEMAKTAAVTMRTMMTAIFHDQSV